jgi:hypothetical protein
VPARETTGAGAAPVTLAIRDENGVEPGVRSHEPFGSSTALHGMVISAL